MENIEPRLDAQNILSAGSRWGPALVQSPILPTPYLKIRGQCECRVQRIIGADITRMECIQCTVYSVQCTVAYQADSQN